MKITALEEYGLRCMLLLARSWPNATLTLPDFKVKEGLSIPYAAKLLMILKKAGLVKAVRGRNGGYMLAKSPDQIVLKEVFDALGEPAFSPMHCDKHSGLLENCVHQGDCRVREIWQTFGALLGQIMDRITLADLLSGNLAIIEGINLEQRQSFDV